ncbi:MAG: rhodanese-like domain-containing protein [Candidatus Gracilibacteria bacterium]|nr:rhodanese-like domain-containing protein [Candidatus Gracilibacteria bacterium]
MSIRRLHSKQFSDEVFKKDTILIDIRTPEEKKIYGYIKGTDLFFDIYSKKFVPQLLTLDRNKKYLIYCWHGNRTQYLLEYMSMNGFTDVSDLVGGIEYWEYCGFKLIKD